MLDEEGAKWCVFLPCLRPHPLFIYAPALFAMPAGSLSFPSLFHTWTPLANRTYDCTILEAARATSAAPTFFNGIEFEKSGLQQSCKACYRRSDFLIALSSLSFPSEQARQT